MDEPIGMCMHVAWLALTWSSERLGAAHNGYAACMDSDPTAVVERTSGRRASSRRAAILDVAVRLFATHGYHGVSMDDIGAAAGVTGPALYHHFAGKEAMLAEALTPVSEGLLTGARELVASHAGNDSELLAAFVEFHVSFAVDNPAVIALHLHELARLPVESRDAIRRIQRSYVEEWVAVLQRVHPGWPIEQARAAAHAAFGLMNSTPFLGANVSRAQTNQLLRDMALGALRAH